MAIWCPQGSFSCLSCGGSEPFRLNGFSLPDSPSDIDFDLQIEHPKQIELAQATARELSKAYLRAYLASPLDLFWLVSGATFLLGADLLDMGGLNWWILALIFPCLLTAMLGAFELCDRAWELRCLNRKINRATEELQGVGEPLEGRRVVVFS